MNYAPEIVFGVIAIAGIALLVFLQMRATQRRSRGVAGPVRYGRRIVMALIGIALILGGIAISRH